MPTARLIKVLLVGLSAAPIAAIALWSIGNTVTDVFDPCVHWQYAAREPMSLEVGPHDACRSATVHGESKTRALIRAATVPGGMLFASILALMGAAFSRRLWLIGAGVFMLAETLLVLSIAPLTFAAGLSYVVLARRR